MKANTLRLAVIAATAFSLTGCIGGEDKHPTVNNASQQTDNHKPAQEKPATPDSGSKPVDNEKTLSQLINHIDVYLGYHETNLHRKRILNDEEVLEAAVASPNARQVLLKPEHFSKVLQSDNALKAFADNQEAAAALLANEQARSALFSDKNASNAFIQSKVAQKIITQPKNLLIALADNNARMHVINNKDLLDATLENTEIREQLFAKHLAEVLASDNADNVFSQPQYLADLMRVERLDEIVKAKKAQELAKADEFINVAVDYSINDQPLANKLIEMAEITENFIDNAPIAFLESDSLANAIAKSENGLIYLIQNQQDVDQKLFNKKEFIEQINFDILTNREDNLGNLIPKMLIKSIKSSTDNYYTIRASLYRFKDKLKNRGVDIENEIEKYTSGLLVQAQNDELFADVMLKADDNYKKKVVAHAYKDKKKFYAKAVEYYLDADSTKIDTENKIIFLANLQGYNPDSPYGIFVLESSPLANGDTIKHVFNNSTIKNGILYILIDDQNSYHKHNISEALKTHISSDIDSLLRLSKDQADNLGIQYDLIYETLSTTISSNVLKYSNQNSSDNQIKANKKNEIMFSLIKDNIDNKIQQLLEFVDINKLTLDKILELNASGIQIVTSEQKKPVSLIHNLDKVTARWEWLNEHDKIQGNFNIWIHDDSVNKLIFKTKFIDPIEFNVNLPSHSDLPFKLFQMTDVMGLFSNVSPQGSNDSLQDTQVYTVKNYEIPEEKSKKELINIIKSNLLTIAGVNGDILSSNQLNIDNLVSTLEVFCQTSCTWTLIKSDRNKNNEIQENSVWKTQYQPSKITPNLPNTPGLKKIKPLGDIL